MKPSYLAIVSSLALLALGCGLSTYEGRLKRSMSTLGHDAAINKQLRADPWGDRKVTKVMLRPPVYMNNVKEKVVSNKGRTVNEAAPDVLPPFMDMPNRLVTFRGRLKTGGDRELPLYLFISGINPQAAGQTEGESGGEAQAQPVADLREQILAAIPTPPDQDTTYTAGGQGSRKPKQFQLLVWNIVGQYPFVVKTQPIEQENLDASLQVFIFTNEKRGTQIALFAFGPTELVTGIAPHDIALCLETVEDIS